MEPLEVAITSDTTGQLWNSCVWDVHSGTSLMQYKLGGVAAPRSLAILGQDYIAAAERTKPILHVWPLNSEHKVHNLRLILPGRATALAFSPDSCYCVAGIEETLYVWQISSGNLLSIIARHYQRITSLKFTDDGSHFVTAGDDGMVLVWNLAALISNSGSDLTSQSVAGQQDPLYIFSDHSLPVSDTFIGKGGIRSRLVTVSIDRTCKIYDLSSGDLLLNLVFDKSLSAVTMDLIEMNVFVGSMEGDIYQFSLVNPPRMREYYLTEADRAKKFTGHTKAVTCLSLSLDGETMISGSNDEQLLVWHIPSRQKTHGIPHKGAITNAFFTTVPKNMFTNTFSPSIILHNLQRTMAPDFEIEIMTNENCDFWEDYEHNSNVDDILSLSSTPSLNYSEIPASKASSEISKLKMINAELYQFALKNILKNP